MMLLALFASRPVSERKVLTFLLNGALRGFLVLLRYLPIVGGGYTRRRPDWRFSPSRS